MTMQSPGFFFVSRSLHLRIASLLLVIGCVALVAVPWSEMVLFLTTNNHAIHKSATGSLFVNGGNLPLSSSLGCFENQRGMNDIVQDKIRTATDSHHHHHQDQPLFIVTTLTTMVGAYAIGALGSWLEQQIVDQTETKVGLVGTSPLLLPHFPGSIRIIARTFKFS